MTVILWVLGLSLLLTACFGDDPPPELPFLQVEEDVQVEMFGVEYIFSDSARLVARLTAGRVAEKKPGGGAEPFHDLSGGVKIELYDGYGRTNGVITSDSAKFYEVKREAILFSHVSLLNQKKERLETDSLTWSQQKDSIFTKSPVHITTAAQEIFARKGMEAKADFSAYNLYGTSGAVEIDEP
ncbi:MAG: LPS export ABC transporter periplasmic protein LptC [Bacteroidia bacterium]|nr:LPS export ABC transporter periplasmic protein LptC [Bacteroidia bacterium]